MRPVFTRFRHVVVLVLAALAVMAPGLSGARAQEGSGLFERLNRLFQAQAPSRLDIKEDPRTRQAAVRDSDARPWRRSGPQTTFKRPSADGRRTLCVRTCDGYAFPLGRLAKRGDLPAHETACRAACPGAETRLYTQAAGRKTEDVAGARAVSDGSLYRSLATAFLFKTKLAPSCSCQGPDQIAARVPFELDPTLRSGDVVIGRGGTAKVFDGTTRIPHAPSSFAAFRQSPALNPKARLQVDALLGVSSREAQERSFRRSIRSRQASLEPIAAPAGTAANVQAFRLISGGRGFVSNGGSGPNAGSGVNVSSAPNVRIVAPAFYVVR